MTSTPLYNFRIAPEAMWLVINTVIGAALTTLMTTDFTTILDWKAWGIGFAIATGRTALGALLTAASGGQFLGRGETPDSPTGG